MGVVQPAAQPPTLPFFPPFSSIHQRSARFSIRCRDNEVLIATGDRFESQCATRVYSSPAFPPFFNTSFLFRFNRCTSKVVSTIFPTPSVQTLFRASLSLSLSLSRVIPSLFISFPPIRVFFSKRFFDRALPNFIPSCINICARIDKQRRGGGRKGTNYFAGREPYYIENCSRGETNSSTLEEDVRTVVQKSIRRRISRGRCDREQGGRWEGNKVAVCRSKCQISVAVSPFRAS